MKRVVGGPLSQLLEWPAAVLDHTVVHAVQLSGRREDGNEAWNAVHDQARLALPFAQSLLGALQIVDVVDRSVPMNDPTLAVMERLSHGLDPSELTVCAPELVDIVVRRSRCHRMQPAAYNRVAVIGVNELEPMTT